MKIAILHPFLFRLSRGIERFTISLSYELSKMHISVDLLTWRSSNPVAWEPLPSGVRSYQMPALRYFESKAAVFFYFYRLLVGKYDWVVVYFAGYGESEALTFLRRFRRHKTCIVFHFPCEHVPHRYKEFRRYRLVEKADALVAVSDYVAAGVRKTFGRECSVIHNGVNPDAFTPNEELRREGRNLLGLQGESPVLITLSALEERKGIQWVIRALPILLQEFPDVVYIVLGEGRYRQSLEQECRQLGVTNAVRLLGSSDRVVTYLGAADLGCLLSEGEAMAISLLEYMAMELPVVTSTHRPFDQFVRPDWGVTVDEHNSPEVARVVSELLRDRTLRITMGKRGREEVLKNYTWSRVARKYADLFTGDRTSPTD
jgi:glycosyltransferase involved in cell wall biosynthesis